MATKKAKTKKTKTKRAKTKTTRAKDAMEVEETADVTNTTDSNPALCDDSPVMNKTPNPTMEEVKEWNKDKLLKWIQQERPKLLDDDDDEKFEAAKISGDVFLTLAGDVGFFRSQCNLPPGPSKGLANLAEEMNAVNKQGVKRKSDQEESLARARARARVRLNEFASPAPSSLAKPDRFKVKASGLVKCNRPFDYSTLPISLLQREFAEFKDDLILEPSVIAFKLLDDLTLASCKWHDNENLRRDEIASVIGNTANVSLLPTFISGSSRSTDGNTHPATVIPALIRGCKNNEGCALFEAIAYYSNFLRCHLNLSDGQTELFTRFPSILMADVGTQIGFYCCVWTGQNILVEPLTPIYDLTTHWTDEKMRQQIAVALGAVLKTIPTLNQHYQRINESPRTKIQNEYPFQNSYVDHTGLCTEFTYTSRIQNKLVFKAVSKANDDLVIKFTRRYSSTAHGFLASLGHAPAIRAINDIPGGWKMIVMESSPYTLLYDLCPILDDKTRSAIKETVKEVTGKLHLQELVHGDIRQANILVSERTLNSPEGISFHLIDFDWAGPAGAVKYPMGVNIETIRRPRDVAGGKLITKSHDLEMINLLF
ncbi:hypothetical protein V8E54_012256 [Elaphomyces granulatus]